MAILIAFSLAATHAFAQGDQPATDPAVRDTPQDCRAAPADQPAGENTPVPDTSKLADCGGVLKPPSSADGEMVEHPEEGGEMPVIPPSQVPPDQGTVQ